MKEIKAIETRYLGCRFRSRLEARWAYFFNALAIRFEYEKEGFSLPSGPYLPDFWLPDLELWLEVKGERAPETQVSLVKELADHTGHAAVLWQGLPAGIESHYGRIWCCDVADEWQGHSGGIYKALKDAGWVEDGFTKPERTYVKNGRMMSRKRGPKTLTQAEMLADGCICLGSFRRKRFVNRIRV